MPGPGFQARGPRPGVPRRREGFFQTGHHHDSGSRAVNSNAPLIFHMRSRPSSMLSRVFSTGPFEIPSVKKDPSGSSGLEGERRGRPPLQPEPTGTHESPPVRPNRTQCFDHDHQVVECLVRVPFTTPRCRKTTLRKKGNLSRWNVGVHQTRVPDRKDENTLVLRPSSGLSGGRATRPGYPPGPACGADR